MTRLTLPRRTRSFLLWTARLALVAYLVQLSALDHWHSHVGDVVGVEGSAAHVEHCHGAGDCSGSGGSAIAAHALPAGLPVPSAAWSGPLVPAQPQPDAAFISPPSEPPRAA